MRNHAVGAMGTSPCDKNTFFESPLSQLIGVNHWATHSILFYLKMSASIFRCHKNESGVQNPERAASITTISNIFSKFNKYMQINVAKVDNDWQFYRDNAHN